MSNELYVQHSFLPEPTRIESPKPQRVAKTDLKLREAITPYIDPAKLRTLASNQGDITEALRTGELPDELNWLLSLLATMLKPIDRDQVKGPSDIAAHLMLRMGHLCQEQFCVVCLNTKNRIQKIHTVYQGTIDTIDIRVAEAYREPIKLNSSGVIFAHNHPGGDPTPSPEDIRTTKGLVEAGQLLDIPCLDHMVITRDKWVSLREKRLGFEK